MPLGDCTQTDRYRCTRLAAMWRQPPCAASALTGTQRATCEHNTPRGASQPRMPPCALEGAPLRSCGAQRAAAMHATLHLQTASLAKARDELGATTASIRALNAEFELMADTLQFETQGIGRAAVKEVAPRAQLRSAWAASDDAN